MEKKPTVVIGDGNAYAIMGRVKDALKKAGMEDKMDEYLEKARSGDYDNLLRVTMDYVEIKLVDYREDEDEDEAEEQDEEME